MRRLMSFVQIASLTVCVYASEAATDDWASLQPIYDRGSMALSKGQYASARADLEAAAKGVEALPPADAHRALVYHELASLYDVLGRSDLARPLYEKALGIWNLNRDVNLMGRAVTLNNLGSLLLEQGHWQEAEDDINRALEIFRKERGEEDAHTIHAQNNLCEVYITEGRNAEAEGLLAASLAAQRKNPKRGTEFINSLDALGRLYLFQNRFAESERAFQEAYELVQNLPETTPTVPQVISDLGTLYRVQGNLARAEPLLRKAIHIYETAFSPENPLLAMTLAQTAALAMQEKKFTLAEQKLTKAAAIFRKAFGPDAATVAQAEGSLAYAIYMQGRFQEAERWLHDAIAIEERAYPGADPNLASAHASLAVVYTHEDKRDEAEEEYRRAIAMYEASGSRNDAGLESTLEGYARLLKAQHNRKQEARDLEKRAKAIRGMALRPAQ